MNASRSGLIWTLIAACALLALIVAWIQGRSATLPAGGASHLPSAEPFEEPGAPALASGDDAFGRVAAEEAREDAAVPNVPTGAVLGVLVVSRASRDPIAGIRVYLNPGDEPHGISSQDVDGSRGRIGLAPITGDDGRVEFDAPDHVPLRLLTYAPEGDAQSTTLDVPALELGERREIVVELLTDGDLRFCGIVLARADRRPIAGALVHLEYPGRASADRPRETTSDAEGRFEIQIASWKTPHLRIEASTFGVALVSPETGHESPATAVVILLERSATLKLHLTEAGGLAVLGARFRAGTEGQHTAQPDDVSLMTSLLLPDPSWEGETDAEGRCSLEGVSSGAPLTFEIARDGIVVRKESEPFTLRPGEVREIEWRIGAGCRLIGRVVDQANALVANQELWVLRPESELPESLNGYAERRVAKRTTTDGEGNYAVEDLDAGRWCIGPAPSKSYRKSAEEPAIAPVAVFAEIPEDAREIRCDLRVHRGLYIRGRVVDPSGAPVPHAAVLGDSREFTLHDSVGAVEDGTFVFGPLVPGRYGLHASSHGEYGDSDRVEASAGDEGVVLRLERGAVLSGTVVDARSGAACSARLTVTSPEAETPTMMLAETQADGTFRIEGLKSGPYDIAAHTGDARVGFVRGAEAAGGTDPGGIEVRVVPGAKLRIRYEGKARYGTFQVTSGGVVLGVDSLEGGTTKMQGVSAGRVIVRFTLWDPEWTQEKTLDLATGEEREIVFTDEG